MRMLPALVFTCLLAPAALVGQSVTGSIVGAVRDSSGAVIQRAEVKVTHEGTNVSFNTATNESGDYVAPDLPPGSYTVRVESPGFRPAVFTGVRLLANRTVRVDATLEPGAVTQAIEVQASAPVVNSESATIGNIMDGKTVAELPLNGRRLDRLLQISAGVTSDSASNPRVAGSAYWGGIKFNVDGLIWNDTGNGGGAYSFRHGLVTLPSVDTVSEFKIDSNNMKAEYEGGASVTVVTKSGTNAFHGAVFHFNRNRAYAAKNFFATGLPKPPFNRNEFGFVIGGPIRKDRTFFFGTYEGLRERFPLTYTISTATQAMRNGDFTGLPVIVDPLNGVPFAQNRIPDTRIDPRSRRLISFVPLPNLPGVGPAGTISNYNFNSPNSSDINRYGLRIDHKFSDRDRVYGNYNYSKGLPYSLSRGTPANYGNWTNAGYHTQGWNFTYSKTLTARALNEARFGYFYHASDRIGQNLDFNPQELFPTLYGPLPFGGLPRVDITGHVQIGDYGGTSSRQYTLQYVDNFTYVRGSHTIKTGLDFSNERVFRPSGAFGLFSAIAQEAAFGRFSFSGRFSNDNPGRPAQPAHAFADFLLGYPDFSYRSTASAMNLFYGTRYSAYIQDDWQATPRLTLNFGLRYMVQTMWKERDRAQTRLDLSTSRLLIPGGKMPPQAQPRLVTAYPIATTEGEAYNTDKNNFGPRFGFAWRPFSDSRTVLRGGAGFYYNTLPLFIGFLQGVLNNPPFLLAETFEAAAGSTPSLSLAQPFPGAGALSPNPGITTVEQNILNSLSQQWNLTVERELVSNLGLRVSYVGNKTTHLPWYNRPINLPQQQAPGALQPRRPYQPWSDVLLLSSGGDSTLHQLQVEAVRRYANGLTFQLEYSWNRSLDNVPIVGGTQDPYNARADRGNSEGVRRHIFTLAYTYELPFGPNRRFANVGGALGHVIGGWEVAGITYLRSGTPFSVSFSPTLAGWHPSRADVLRDPKLPPSERSILRWFDTSAFAVPAPFTYGNSARNLLFGPGDIVFDVSVLKNTRIREGWNLQFRAEFFNFPNHPNFGNPGANISVPASVGRIFSAGDPRIIQWGLKLLF